MRSQAVATLMTKACPVLCAVFAGALLGFGTPSLAQQQRQTPPSEASPSLPTPEEVFESIGRWFRQSFESADEKMRRAREEADNFNREAGIAMRSTAKVARDAADSVTRSRVVRGHQTCPPAANGAPDCVAAAAALCRKHGFDTGKSVDMTAAEECPTEVMLNRRQAQPGECKPVTFVTRAFCQ
jgi:hypothetical protein